MSGPQAFVGVKSVCRQTKHHAPQQGVFGEKPDHSAVIFPVRGPIFLLRNRELQFSEDFLKTPAYLLQHRSQKAVLVVEVVVNRSLAKSRPLDDFVVGGRVESMFREFLYRRVDKPRPLRVVQPLPPDYRKSPFLIRILHPNLSLFVPGFLL
jgi:hypothetical protein